MKKILKKLLKIEANIKLKNKELIEVGKSLYYSSFDQEEERQRDILEIQHELKELMSLKYSTLETLQIKIDFIKPIISNKERELALIINK